MKDKVTLSEAIEAVLSDAERVQDEHRNISEGQPGGVVPLREGVKVVVEKDRGSKFVRGGEQLESVL